MSFSQIEFPDFDVLSRMLSRILIQFRERENSAPVFMAILEAFASELQELMDAVKEVQQLRTPYSAVEEQLNVIGRLVGQPRELVDFSTFDYFTVDVPFKSLDFAPAWVENVPTGSTLIAGDVMYKDLILAKIFRNRIKYGSVPEIQAFIKAAFGVKCSIEIIDTLTIKIYVEFSTSDNLIDYLGRKVSTVNCDSIYFLPLPATVFLSSITRLPPPPPVASVTGDVNLNKDVVGNFDATASTVSMGATIVSHQWDWDYNGVTFVPSGDTGSTQTHSWSSAGTKTVAVKVTDDYGGTDIATMEVVINASVIGWNEVAAQLNSQTWINALTEFNSKIYAGTTPGARLFESSGGSWTQVAPQLATDTLCLSLAVFNGTVYGGMGDSGGSLQKWNGSNAWTSVFSSKNGQTKLNCMKVFNSKLYIGTGNGGRLFEVDTSDTWAQVAPQYGSDFNILSLEEFNGYLFGGTDSFGDLLQWNGSNAWVQKAPWYYYSGHGYQTHIYSLAVFNGELYGGSGPNGCLLKWNGTDAWVLAAGQLGSETQIPSLVVWNNELYGGTYPNGKLYKFTGTAWEEVCAQLNSQYSIPALLVFNSFIHGGTILGGRLFKAITG